MGAAAGGRDAAVHENILVNMADGVVSIGLEGEIMTFNPAAGAILGLDPVSVVGRTYAELFFEDEGLDDLNELVLKAIYESETTHSQEIEVRCGPEPRNLMVSTTFLRAGAGAGEEGERIGVIVVLSDVTEERKRKKIKRLFGEFMDPRIVARLLERGVGLDEGSRRVMTVSFLDLEGFTRLGERLPAQDFIAFLNAYLSVMSRPIGEEGGVTDKYIGDAIMAFWGPPFTEGEDHAARACRSALAQRAALDDLRAEVRGMGIAVEPAAVEMRCGIATGELVFGAVGPANARNFTVIGDTVNLAARLEAENKAQATRVLVSEMTRRQAGNAFDFREAATVAVRGRTRAERVFELLGAR